MSKATGPESKVPGSGASFNDHAPSPLMTLPYTELSKVLIRAHRNAWALTEVNRTLLDSLRGVVRRQQDLAMQITEQAAARARKGEPINPAEMFDRAADAVREIGQACIDAQLCAIRQLEAQAGQPAAIEPPSAAASAVPAGQRRGSV